MNIHHNESLREKLASEYVLGTLRAGARRRFETWLRHDAALKRAVAEWQDRLHPLADMAPSVKPSQQVWRDIEHHLHLEGSYIKQSGFAFWRGLHEDVSFWRGLGLVSTAVATILVAVLATKQPEPAAPLTDYVAMLADDKAQTVAVVTGDARRHQLIVKLVVQPAVAADRSLQLWAVPTQGAPRSLGLLDANGAITLPLPDNATPQSIPLLAISVEPKGGSPDPNGPTGPILFKGAWVQI
jgi:anti-sigma-K factor RskA